MSLWFVTRKYVAGSPSALTTTQRHKHHFQEANKSASVFEIRIAKFLFKSEVIIFSTAFSLHMFIFLLNSTLKECSTLWPFLLDCLFSYSRVVRVLYIFWIQILCICITNISFQFLAYFITNVFWKTVALILINSNPSAFIFLLWLFIYFLFSVKNHCLQQSCEDFLLSFVRSMYYAVVLCLVVWPIFVTFPL